MAAAPGPARATAHAGKAAGAGGSRGAKALEEEAKVLRIAAVAVSVGRGHRAATRAAGGDGPLMAPALMALPALLLVAPIPPRKPQAERGAAAGSGEPI